MNPIPLCDTPTDCGTPSQHPVPNQEIKQLHPRVSRYPWKSLPRLASAIEHGDRTLAYREMGELLDIIARDTQGTLDLNKLRCAQIISGCLRGAQSGGAASEILLDEHRQILATIARSRSWNTVKRRMYRYVDTLLSGIPKEQIGAMENIILKVRHELQTSEGQMRSLAQYAQDFGISEGHLSRSFRLITGQTFRDELRRARMGSAKRLLLETGTKISAIVGQIGLRDTSQFISDFRAEVGLTPGEYRKQKRQPSHQATDQ